MIKLPPGPPLAPSSIPVSEPLLRFHLPEAGERLEPLFHGPLLFARHRRNVWAAFSEHSEKPVVTGQLDRPYARVSHPGLAEDGRVGALVFESLEKGLSFHEFAPDGTPLGRCETGFDYEREEGPTPADMGVPDWEAGPGPLLRPIAGPDATWIACVAASPEQGGARWQTACVRPGEKAPRWSRSDVPLGAAGGIGIFRAGKVYDPVVAVDLRSGEERWRAEDDSSWTGCLAGGCFVRCDAHGGRLSVRDVETGKLRFEAEVSRDYSAAVHLATGRVLHHCRGELSVFTLDGDRVFSGKLARFVLCFDGERMLCSENGHDVVCRLAAEPGRVLWTVKAQPEIHESLRATAGSGRMCIYTDDFLPVTRLWMFAPPPDLRSS